jgi:hypothetical protein
MADIEDIEPEMREPTAREEKHARKQVKAPGRTGDFEKLAVQQGSELAATLVLDDKIKHDGGGTVRAWEQRYNMYVPALRGTIRAMGRTKDILLTGAPMRPDQMSAKLAKRFHKLSLTAKDDGPAQSAMGNWADAQTQLKIDGASLRAGQTTLKAAVEGYRAVQMLFDQRALEAKRAGMTEELEQLEHKAEVCARVVEVSAEAIAGASEIGEALDSGAELDASAEGMVGDGEEWSGTGQKVAEGAEGAIEGAHRAKEILEAVQKHAESGSISLKDVFIVAAGDAGKYFQLQKDLAELDEAIAGLDTSREKEQAVAARTALDGFKMDVSVKKQALRADREDARNRAQEFAQNAAGGQDAVLAMYAAEAYQELDTFGTLAEQQRSNDLDPIVGDVYDYVDRKWAWFEGENVIGSGTKFRDSVAAVLGQKQYFDEHLPEWQQTAEAWRTFLEDRTTKKLIND